jgi:hypothetical protein
LIVEGDVDESINTVLAGTPDPDPNLKTGDYDYRERVIFMQSLKSSGVVDPDAPLQSGNIRGAAINGSPQPQIITMQPGAVERWRILNGSVDGGGYKRFMVLKGEYQYANFSGKNVLATITGDIISLDEIEAEKQNIYQLAMDGVTFVTANPDGSDPVYTIKDLSQANPNATSTPLPTDYTKSAADTKPERNGKQAPWYSPPTFSKNTRLIDAWVNSPTNNCPAKGPNCPPLSSSKISVADCPIFL